MGLKMANAKILGAGLVLLVVFSASAEAKLYKWVDEKGVTHYGETIPPEYAGKDNVQFNDQGRVIKRTDKIKQADLIESGNKVARLQQELAKAQEKGAAVKASFEADKAHYRELTGSSTREPQAKKASGVKETQMR